MNELTCGLLWPKACCHSTAIQLKSRAGAVLGSWPLQAKQRTSGTSTSCVVSHRWLPLPGTGDMLKKKGDQVPESSLQQQTQGRRGIMPERWYSVPVMPH